jgi:hypothetical protein
VLRLFALPNAGHGNYVQSLERLGHAADVRVRVHGGTYAQACLFFAVSINVLASNFFNSGIKEIRSESSSLLKANFKCQKN